MGEQVDEQVGFSGQGVNVGRSTPKQGESIRRTEGDEKSLIKTAAKVQNSESLGKKGSEDDLLTKR